MGEGERVMTNREDDISIELIDFEETMLKNGELEALFYMRDLQQRKLHLNEDVSQMSVADVVAQIMRFNKEDKGKPVEERQPILLYVVSNGGEVDSGFELIDVIRASKTPVYTVNLGYQYSMGFLIGLAGHRRYATKNAKFLMHDGSQFIYNSGMKVQDQMEFQKKVEERVKRYVTEMTKITPELYDSYQRVEWYMFADEAKELGVTDFIIGEDCDLDEVV